MQINAGTDEGAPGASAESRRRFLKKAGMAGAAAAVWTAPTVVSVPAYAQGSVPCSGTDGFFTWNRAAYTSGSPGQRSGAPGGANAMTVAGGWTSHPTFTDTTYATTTPVTITYLLQGTTFLNTAGGESHGVSAATTSAPFKSYRVSKTGNPTLGDAMTIVIQFSADVGCPTVVIGDIDNNLLTGVNGCTGTGTTAAWADRLSATAYTGLNATGSTAPVARIAGTGGSNITPGVGTSGPWDAIQCAGVANTSDISNLTLQVTGTVREIRLTYVSNFNATTGNGNQHIALGDISFYY